MFSSFHGHYNVITHNCAEQCSMALYAAGQLLAPVGTSIYPRIDEIEEGSKPLSEIENLLQHPESGPGYR